MTQQLNPSSGRLLMMCSNRFIPHANSLSAFVVFGASFGLVVASAGKTRRMHQQHVCDLLFLRRYRIDGISIEKNEKKKNSKRVFESRAECVSWHDGDRAKPATQSLIRADMGIETINKSNTTIPARFSLR